MLNSFETFNVFLQVWGPRVYTVTEMRVLYTGGSFDDFEKYLKEYYE